MRASPETGDKPRRGRAKLKKALVTRSRGDAEHLSRSRIRRDNAIIALAAFLPQFCSLQVPAHRRDKGSLSAAEFEELKQQVLREPGSFAAQAPVLLAPTAPPPPRCLSPPPPDAYMLPAMAMPPRVVPRPPAYAPQPPYAAVPGPPRGYGVPQLVPRGYDAPPPPYASVPRPPRPPDPRYGPPRYAYGAPPPGPGTYPTQPRPRPPYDPRAPPRPPLN